MDNDDKYIVLGEALPIIRNEKGELDPHAPLFRESIAHADTLSKIAKNYLKARDDLSRSSQVTLYKKIDLTFEEIEAK